MSNWSLSGEVTGKMVGPSGSLSEQWQAILDDAQKVGGDEAVSALNQKLNIVRNYMLDSWDVDIDVLRAAILRRGKELSSLDLEHLK
jgi:hypothetical protein